MFLVYFDIVSNIFIIILQYLHYKLSECTYSSNRLKYLHFKLSYISIENNNYLNYHIDLIIIKVNYCSQCFSFISTLIL